MSLAARGGAMTSSLEEHETFVRDQLPHDWKSASEAAGELWRRSEFLTWNDRATILDEFVWSRARTMLSNEEITAVINRARHSHGGSYALLEYSTVCGVILTSVMLRLKEPHDICSPHHALSCLLSREPEHQRAGTEWVREAGPQAIERALSRLPGYAFLLMSIYPNDSAECFMARDAFWAAMLGR